MQSNSILGRLTIQGNSPVLINGIKSVTGDTVTSGAIVETLNDTEATVNLGPLGSVELQRGTKVRIDYQCASTKQTPDAPACTVRSTLLKGCLISNYKQDSHHEIRDQRDALKVESDIDREKNGGGALRICDDGSSPQITDTGLGSKKLIAILLAAIGTSTTIALIAAGGDNPSNSTP